MSVVRIVGLRDARTCVMCEMVGAVDVRALGEQGGHLSHDGLRDIDDALALVLDLV